MAKNSIALKGNLARDPFFDYLSGRNSPVPFMRFTLAVVCCCGVAELNFAPVCLVPFQQILLESGGLTDA